MQPSTRRGPYRTGIARRAQIVDVAFAVFARHGYAGTSLRRVADEVGITPAGLLRHFAGKEDLLTAVLDRWDERSETAVAPHRTGLARVLHYGDSLRVHEQQPGLLQLYLTMCGEASDPQHPAAAWVRERFERIVADAVEHLRIAVAAGEIAPMDDERIEAEARAMWALMDGLELQWVADPGGFPLADTFDRMFATTVARWQERTPA